MRVDYQRDEALAATIGANPIVPDFLPEIAFQGADSGVRLLDISPRFGLTYDLGGDGRTIAKVSANRFYGQGVFTAGILNPVAATSVSFPWNDANGDRFVQRSELDLARLLRFSANYNPANPAASVSANQVDASLANDSVNVSGVMTARDGFPFIPNILAPTRTGRLTTVRLLVEPYGTSRYDPLVLLDVKAEKRFTMGKVNVIGSLDVFNVTNTNTVLSRVTTQNSGSRKQGTGDHRSARGESWRAFQLLEKQARRHGEKLPRSFIDKLGGTSASPAGHRRAGGVCADTASHAHRSVGNPSR